jgi:hypothetical protein
MVSIHKKTKNKLKWFNVESSIYNENSSSSFQLKLFGKVLWTYSTEVFSKHDMSCITGGALSKFEVKGFDKDGE